MSSAVSSVTVSVSSTSATSVESLSGHGTNSTFDILIWSPSRWRLTDSRQERGSCLAPAELDARGGRHQHDGGVLGHRFDGRGVDGDLGDDLRVLRDLDEVFRLTLEVVLERARRVVDDALYVVLRLVEVQRHQCHDALPACRRELRAALLFGGLMAVINHHEHAQRDQRGRARDGNRGGKDLQDPADPPRASETGSSSGSSATSSSVSARLRRPRLPRPVRRPRRRPRSRRRSSQRRLRRGRPPRQARRLSGVRPPCAAESREPWHARRRPSPPPRPLLPRLPPRGRVPRPRRPT